MIALFFTLLIATLLLLGFSNFYEFLLPVFYVFGIALCIYILLFLVYQIYAAIYFKSKGFLQIKKAIQKYVFECNALNAHIEQLKKAYIDFKQTDYGSATYIDSSVYNFKRTHLRNAVYKQEIYNCSLTVCKNAQQQPFKYVCKYFNIKADEPTLEKFEKIFNDFSAAEQGKVLLKSKEEQIIKAISSHIPSIIIKFSLKRLLENLGFTRIDFSELYFPKFIFRYISAGGNSTMKCEVIFDVKNLEKFIHYLSESIKFRKSVAGQRALMTSTLREKIKRRDNYTCRICGISTKNEPHLLLEIDHIVPLAKNGLTTEDNLQTLCWKCNRSKGAK